MGTSAPWAAVLLCAATGCHLLTGAEDYEVAGSGAGGEVGCSAIPDGTNNSAVIAGAPIGKGAAPNDTLRKPIDVAIAGGGWTLGKGYATRSVAGSDYADVVVPVTNDTGAAECFIEVESLALQDVSGAAIPGSLGFAFVEGSVGDVGSGIFTDTCLGPGEAGYLWVAQEDAWAAVTRITGSFAPGSALEGRPAASMAPECYEMESGDVLRLTVRNNGAAPGEVRTIWAYPQDDDAAPFTFELGLPDPVRTIAPDAKEAFAMTILFEGHSSRARFFVDFAPPGAQALVLPPTDGVPENKHAEAFRRRQMREREKHLAWHRAAYSQ